MALNASMSEVFMVLVTMVRAERVASICSSREGSLKIFSPPFFAVRTLLYQANLEPSH